MNGQKYHPLGLSTSGARSHFVVNPILRLKVTLQSAEKGLNAIKDGSSRLVTAHRSVSGHILGTMDDRTSPMSVRSPNHMMTILMSPTSMYGRTSSIDLAVLDPAGRTLSIHSMKSGGAPMIMTFLPVSNHRVRRTSVLEQRK